jgi:hypothetical protein
MDLRMADESGGGKRAKDTRQDRLKLALRENLKRRKVQARERGQVQLDDQLRDPATGPSSSDHETCLDGQVGKRDQ